MEDAMNGKYNERKMPGMENAFSAFSNPWNYRDDWLHFPFLAISIRCIFSPLPDP